MLPYWTPMIPPMGICSLKSFLENHGYSVRTDDANIRPELWEISGQYFNRLKSYIPERKRGNFINIGHNVLRNHLMAYFNHEDGPEYVQLIRMLVYHYYYCDISNEQALELDSMIRVFYERFTNYLTGIIIQEKPAMVGLSVLSGNLGPSVYAFKFIKERFPAIKTLMGGGIFADQLAVDSPDYQYFLEATPFIDKIMVGEGQVFWLKYLQGRLPDSKRVFTLKDLGDTVTAILPDYSDINLQFYPYLGATGSRSCPYQCSFCNVAVFWGQYRRKDTNQIIAEMTELYRKYGNQLFFMTDSLLNPYIQEFSNNFIAGDISLYWDGYLRVDEAVCNPENTMLWRRGGFYRARMGVESGSQHVLDLMGKKITPAQIKMAVSSLAYAGIKTTVYCVIGHPGETEADFQQTLDLITELKDDIWEAECNPFDYSYTGQHGSDRWAANRIELFPETQRKMLISQLWDLDTEPSRAEKYDRVFRFTEHCNKLGIPNPYSLQELYQADERWRLLHKNAVPSLIRFKNEYVDENKSIKQQVFARKNKEEDDFGF